MTKLPPLYAELAKAQDGKLLASLANQFGISEADAERAVRTMMPGLTQALGKNIANDEGLAALLKALGSGNHAQYLDKEGVFGDPSIKKDGDAILGHILGNKDTSRNLAARAAADSGIGEIILRQVLPYLASMLMAYLAKQGQGGGAAGGGGMGRNFPSGGGSSDLNDVLNDLSNITRKKTGGSTTHTPNKNPYSDLSDVLKEEGAPGNGTIAGKIRDTLGSALGGGSKGIIGWIISALVYRYGWKIARHFLKRIF